MRRYDDVAKHYGYFRSQQILGSMPTEGFYKFFFCWIYFALHVEDFVGNVANFA